MKKKKSNSKKGKIASKKFEKVEKPKNLRGEKWKLLSFKAPTKGNNYEISNNGRLRSIDKITGNIRLLNPSVLKRGNLKMFNIKLEGNNTQGIYIHKAVAENFVKRKDSSKNKILHLDGVKTNNHWRNLKWCTLSELRKVHIEKGLFPNISERKASNIKLTESKVKRLKKMLKKGKIKKSKIAEKFGISETQVSRIERGENWGHVKIN